MHTHSHTHSRTLTHTHSHTHTHTRTLTHAHSHTLTHARARSHTHSHSHTVTLTLTYTHTHTNIHKLTHSHTHSHTHTHTHTHTLTHTHTHCTPLLTGEADANSDTKDVYSQIYSAVPKICFDTDPFNKCFGRLCHSMSTLSGTNDKTFFRVSSHKFRLRFISDWDNKAESRTVPHHYGR